MDTDYTVLLGAFCGEVFSVKQASSKDHRLVRDTLGIIKPSKKHGLKKLKV